MIIKFLVGRKPRQCCFALLIYALVIGLAGWAHGQINVTTYGAVGDCTNVFNITTTSNSPVISCSSWTFKATDVGKAVELFGCGVYQGASNQDLFCFIAHTNNSTTVTLTTNCQATLNNAWMTYGTYDTAAFTNAIGHCAVPTGTIVIPPGNYFLPDTNAFQSVQNYSLSYTIPLHRGGITFMATNAGTVVLTGQGGWLNYANQGQRSAIFAMTPPMTNNYPLIYTNLIFDGGVLLGNIQNLSWPPSGSTGVGWDGTHHWMITIGGTMIDSLQAYNCQMRHWRGEMMEDTSGSANLFFTVSNCFFWDGDGSEINNFAHNAVDCTFSNANQAEEFYRAYNTNASFMSGCTIENMTGQTGLALNGGYVNNPYYTINNCIFTNYGTAGILFLPATSVNIFSNYFNCGQGFGPDDNGAQGGVGVSNIFAGWNTCGPKNGALFVSYNGTGDWLPQNMFIFSNYYAGSSGICGGYGWSSNVICTFNSGNGNFTAGNSSITGQYPYEATNNSLAYWNYGLGSSVATTKVSYLYGCFAKLSGGVSGSIVALDNSSPWRIPPAAVMIITNSTALNFPIYLSTNITGTPITLNAKTSASFSWNGSAWVYGGNIVVLGAPIMQVSPGIANFGTLMNGNSATNSFIVENVGGDTLNGTASVGAPFSILSGGTYSLGNGQSQTVNVVFDPAATGTYSQYVIFTGGNGTNVAVSGISTNIASGVVPTVSAISANVSNQGTNALLLSLNSGPVQLSATAAANDNDPLSWQWWYNVNGGAQTVYQHGSGTTPTTSLTNSVSAGGNTNVWTLQVTDTKNGLTAQSQLSIYVMVPPPQGIQVAPN
jgi:hypothetical protein